MAAQGHKPLRPVRVLLFAAVLSTVTGVSLSLYRQHKEELEVQRVRALPDKIPGLRHMQPLPQQAGPILEVDPEALEGIPPYPGAYPRDIARGVKGQGAEMKIAWFSTEDSVDEVMDFYARKFEEEKRPWVSHRFHAKHGYVAWMEMPSEKTHTVTVTRSGSQTLVFPSTGYPRKLLEQPPSQPQSLPQFPGIDGGVMFSFDEAQNPRLTWFATIPGKRLSEVRDFYTRGMTEKGWTIEEINEEAQGQVRIQAKGPDRNCSVLLKENSGVGILVYVNMAGGA